MHETMCVYGSTERFVLRSEAIHKTSRHMKGKDIVEIIVAQNAGFCFGVEKAVEEVTRQIGHAGNTDVFTYGDIVHNEAVVEDFAQKGVRVIDNAGDLQTAASESKAAGRDACVVIRAHGVGRNVYADMESSGMRVVDATCPFVKRIHKIVREAGEQGHTVVVVGNPEHPEVQGITGWANGPVFVVETKEEADALALDADRPVTVVAQTTFRRQKFEEIVEIFIKNRYNVHIADTICNATHVRQEETKQIAASVDAMIVVGGAHSSNTRKLYEISASFCKNTYLVQNAGDLKGVRLKDCAKVGITAGASTPKKTIEEVLFYVRNGTGSDV